MGRRRAYAPLNIFLNARLVGQLNREPSGAIDFRYEASWLTWEHTMPVSLSLPLREDRYIGEPVMAVFDNLLPDNETIRRRLAEKARATGQDAFSLLSAIGRDCVGALQFIPQGHEPEAAGALTGRPVEEAEIARIIRNLAHAPLGIDEDEEFRISIAGAQEKTALLYHEGRWHIPHGTTATTHILKPQIGKLENGIDLSQSVENEHFCLRLLGELGLPVTNSAIIEFEDVRVLSLKRFDRRWANGGERLLRLPQEDCCQALSVSPTGKYEQDGGPGIGQILELLKASDTPDDDRKLFFKAQVINWLLGATDGHAKNFSIFIHPGGGFRLTPLYDVMSAQLNVDRHQITQNKMKLAMAVGNSRHYRVGEIAPRHFQQTATRCGLADAVVEATFLELQRDMAGALDRTRAAMPEGFPIQIVDSIANGVLGRMRMVDLSHS
ncbi:MAG: type II toxin-antitoxin system HipA family toxin [Rhodospirillaceae bacterium]|jgi:serine/threonine-protein kinase HipA|nr:type II toxin-antitoxin system HipA family toxin [Rhodospirillaceae bacterium]MBT5243164.1 type II toxin-antitoxin system HipA family toxin [Rhodospirillaceae bacterium]MBT5563389.1 type II toxin-antitoxin system HipA family toxin [Rhodospirillaceae bacterium]MBT6243703.1 type II toxin-antitoxin system HipA family toxin [Rhodospirillaceae bacterium]MBT7136996.1 type II toxin-antitoxin system HipA family toxin [Rhodospirillaceae bacterium]